MSFSVFLPLIIFIVFLPSVFYLMTRSRRIMLKVCFALAIFSVTGGFLFYSYGYLSSGATLADVLLSALRGILSTARMFFLNNDYGELVTTHGAVWLANNVCLQVLFWLCHVAALIVMQAALFSLFGRSLSDYLRLRFGFYRETYIIKGSGKYALMLGEDIATCGNPKQRREAERLVVFLIEEGDDAKKITEQTTHFGGIVKVLDKQNDILYYLRKTGLGKSQRHNKKYNIILTQNDVSAPDDALLIVEFAKTKGEKPENLNIFVMTSSEWDREKIEEITQASPHTIHIINETDLLIRQMIEEHPPFKCSGLNFNKKGMATHDFTVMILGFGTVGQQTLLRLIMNGQFAGSNMRAIIIDREIEHFRKHFLHCHPYINLSCKIEFKDFDVRDDDFFNLLDNVKGIDYIVVALSDDEASRQTALDIRLHHERKDINILPVIAVYEKNSGLHTAKQDGKIFTFGCREAVYKEDVIIREKLDLMAKTVNDTYAEMYGGQSWHELDWFLQESNRASAGFIPAMLKLAGRKEEEAIDKGTLTEDNTLAEVLAQTEHMRWNAFHAAMGYRAISIEEMRQRFEMYPSQNNPLDFCRKDSKARLQACLVPWDELDKVSEAYRELERRTGKEPKRNFKNNDRDIINFIPKFLKAAKGKERSNV